MIAQHEILPERHGERGPRRRQTVVVRGSPIVQIASDENDVALELPYFCYEPADRTQVPDVPQVNIAHQRRGPATPRLRKILELHRYALYANCSGIDNSTGADQQSGRQKHNCPLLPVWMQAHNRCRAVSRPQRTAGEKQKAEGPQPCRRQSVIKPDSRIEKAESQQGSRNESHRKYRKRDTQVEERGV